jgi:hypothetical protein
LAETVSQHQKVGADDTATEDLRMIKKMNPFASSTHRSRDVTGNREALEQSNCEIRVESVPQVVAGISPGHLRLLTGVFADQRPATQCNYIK